jgi:hypothetical protein
VLTRWDEVAMIRHDEFLEHDYKLMNDIGCTGIRDAARWYITHPAPGVYNWEWLDRMVNAAEKHGLKLYLDLWHYGYPDWMDIMTTDAIHHFVDFATKLARRYSNIEYWCICNEPTLLIDWGGRLAHWKPFHTNPGPLRQQVSKMIIEASKAVKSLLPNAVLALPDPWFDTGEWTEDQHAMTFDTVLGRRFPELGGSEDLIDVIGLNHYRDTTIPPFHKLLLNARKRYPTKAIWLAETSGPPEGWQQTEWFWWMLAETRLANFEGANIDVFTWAPIISMYDWFEPERQLANGAWIIGENGERIPNGKMPEAINLARSYGYLV